MNGNRFLADTNCFIYLLDKHPSLHSLLESEWVFSFITEIELLGKPGITSNEIENINTLLSICIKAPHTESINKTAIQLKQQYKIKVPDVNCGYSHRTENSFIDFDKSFTRIKEVDLILPEL